MAAFTGRVAVVTGGGRGIGAATADVLSTMGAAVAVLARSRAEVDAVAARAQLQGGRSLAVTCDLADMDAVTRAFTQIARELGPVDILVNNAAVVTPLGPTVTIDLAAWQQAMMINLVGPMTCIKAVLPGMLERGWGRIVNVSTGAAARTGMGNANAYAVSKSGLEMLTRNLAAELAGTGVTVNAVRPGTVDTAMQTGIREGDPATIGDALVSRFREFYASGSLLDPILPGTLIARLIAEDTTGETVSFGDERAIALMG